MQSLTGRVTALLAAAGLAAVVGGCDTGEREAVEVVGTPRSFVTSIGSCDTEDELLLTQLGPEKQVALCYKTTDYEREKDVLGMTLVRPYFLNNRFRFRTVREIDENGVPVASTANTMLASRTGIPVYDVTEISSEMPFPERLNDRFYESASGLQPVWVNIGKEPAQTLCEGKGIGAYFLTVWPADPFEESHERPKTKVWVCSDTFVHPTACEIEWGRKYCFNRPLYIQAEQTGTYDRVGQPVYRATEVRGLKTL